MKVERLEVRAVEMPLVSPFASSGSVTTSRTVVLVEVDVDGAVGWGECAAPTEPGYTDEHAAGALAVIRDRLGPAVLAADQPDAPTADAAIDLVDRAGVRSPRHPMATAAIEAALIDAALRHEGRSLADWLGVTPGRVPAGASIGLADPATMADEAAVASDSGYRRLKVKIAPGAGADAVAAVRQGFSGQIHVDANGTYSLDDPAHLDQLWSIDQLDVAVFEQPLPRDAITDHAALAARLRGAISLDESLPDLGALERAVAAGACEVACIKVGRMGGISVARRAIEWCAERGVGAYVGGMHDTAIGRSVNLALAAMAGCTHTSDVAASDRYFVPDLATPHVVSDGTIAVPGGPGCGPRPDPNVIDSLTTARYEIRPGS